MAKCSQCGRHGLFLRVNPRGLCKKCEAADLEQRITQLRNEIADMDAQRTNSAALLKSAVAQAEEKANAQLKPLLDSITQNQEALAHLKEQEADAQKKMLAAQARTTRMSLLCKSAKHAMEDFPDQTTLEEIKPLIDNLDSLVPPADQLNCLTIKELRLQYRQIEKNIKDLCAKYQERYTTKVNATVYKLMVLALESELQLILKTLGYGKLEDAILRVKTMTVKYYQIVADGNQSIAPTILRYIGQLETHYVEKIKLEYEFFVRRERAKEEQRVLREQMRQEAAERKELEQQRKKVEKEEAKYLQEIERLKQQLAEAEADQVAVIQAQMDQLQGQLSEVEERKADIINLQNGKAGTVYVISNLGSFGDDVFKIGMTRRLEPEDRISELSSASVPFPFDVHSFIFSQDAVALETELHHRLNSSRVNKVNLRKEFFHVSLDDLEAMVNDIDPTAPFNRTMAAIQYRQSLSIDAPIVLDDDTETDDDEDDETTD